MKDKLTIGEFNDSFLPAVDGVANVVRNYTVELNRMGHDAYAIVPGYGNDEEYDRINHIDYAIRGKEYCPVKALRPYGITVFPRKVKKVIESIPFDIVHAHCPTFSGGYALKLAKRENIPVVATFHTFFKDDLKEFMPASLADAIVRMRMSFYYACDEVWAPTEACKKRMQDEYYFTGNIRVVQNCADFTPPASHEEFEERKRRGREFCGVNDDTPILLYVGQLKDEKNIPFTLDAVRALHKRGIRFRMVFVGEGHRREAYENYVRQNSLESCVTFLGKITDRDRLGDIYAAAYLFLFPSMYDTAGIVGIEAACFSVPLVVAKGSCTNEGMTDGENGFMVENNLDDYTGKLEYLLSHPEVRNHAGEGARRTIYRSWGDVCRKVEGYYRDIIERKKSQN